jgi:DNA invertase Pin-like site-specific DNA recombinase
VIERFVVADEEITGASLHQRKALQELLEAAKQHPRPFDRVLIDDSSRLARNLEDALRTVAILQFHGVYVTFVSQGFDSQQKTARQLLTLHGMMDEQFLQGLADKVHRGQEGRVLKGLVAGGRCYGYKNVPIEDASKPAKYGRPFVVGVRQEIAEDQAKVVVRVFEMYAGGTSLAGIAKTLNREGVVAPQPPRSRKLRAWCYSSIYEMLRNERYRGFLVWNRTRKERNPETGRKLSKPRPTEEWRRVEVPEWRIVPDGLWERVHARSAEMRKHFGAKTAPGLTRNSHSRYLFSGLLACGECGSKLVIVSGSGVRGYAKYGCPSHRYRGTCANGLMIRSDVLEQQMLAKLEECILRPEMVEFAIRGFQEQLEKRLEEMKAEHSTRSSRKGQLRSEKERLEGQAANIADAIAAGGHSQTLLKRLADIEQQIATIEREAAEDEVAPLKTSVSEIRDFVTRELLDIRGLLRENVAQAKLTLRRHIRDLVLTPMEGADGPFYQATGKWEFLPENKRVFVLVARDGFDGHYTPFGIPALGIVLNPTLQLRA